MSRKPNLLSWDQDDAALPRDFHETDNNRTNSADLAGLTVLCETKPLRNETKRNHCFVITVNNKN